MGGAGTDAALETADVVLMSDDLARVSYAIHLSRRMRRIIKANLTFAIGVIAVLAAANLLVGIPLPLGVVGHEGSTVIVILNGLRLLGYGGGWSDLLHRRENEVLVERPSYQVVAA
jgi:Cd2+/Zn2+-exporting ATPase